jgi:putative heme iron utilization protein
MDTEVLVQEIVTLCEEQHLAVLCTQYNGQPFGNLVVFAMSDDLRYLCFATSRATRKYRNLAADPRLALLIDSRQHYPQDLQAASALTITGRMVEAEEAVRSMLRSRYLVRHPHLRDFLDTPEVALLMVAVAQYDLVTEFQRVRTLHMP